MAMPARLFATIVLTCALGAPGAVSAGQRRSAPAPAPDGTTPLHHAVIRGDRDAVRTLIAAGADVRARNRYGVAPLTLAARNGDVAILETLLAAGADPNTSYGDGETALMTAAKTGRPDALRVLIRRGADVNAQERWLGETALMWAAAEDHDEAVRVLLEAGARIEVRSARTNFAEQKFDIAGMLTTYLPRGEWTALMYAARENARRAARALLDAKADVNAQDPDGSTALVIAIINAHHDFAALLLERGADPNIADSSGMAALYAAVDVNSRDTLFGRPLRPARTTIDGVELVRRLLARGANPNAELSSPIIQQHHSAGNPTMGPGTTPLIRAAKNGDVALFRLLVQHGANVHHRAKNGTTALMAAAQSGTTMFSRAGRDPEGILEVAKLCLDLGIDPNAVNDRGQTAVHLAAGDHTNSSDEQPGANADRYADDLIRILAAAGARLDIADGRGLTPLEIAKRARRGPKTSTVALLQELMGSSEQQPQKNP